MNPADEMQKVIMALLWQYWWILPLVVVAGIVKTAWFKGVLGEFIVNVMTKWRLNKADYHLLKNVTLPTQDGSTQIDHIVVSRYGLFVVETKNFKGWIFGSEKQKQWTQQIYRHKNKFQNPLHQNYKHIKALATTLNIPETLLHSVIVFIGDSRFKTAMPENVTRGGGYIRYIKSKTDIVLSDDEVERITEQIQSGRLQPSLKTHREHAKHVKRIVENQQSQQSADDADIMSEPSCPRCGAAMVRRVAKSGARVGQAFWGCSQYPRCKGTVNSQ